MYNFLFNWIQPLKRAFYGYSKSLYLNLCWYVKIHYLREIE